MKRWSLLTLSALLVLCLAACGGNSASTEPAPSAAPSQTVAPADAPEQPKTQSEPSAPSADAETVEQSSTILIAYFSHTGENYNVGVIDEGNTAKVAKEIAAQTGGELFEIVTVNAYPEAYEECTDVAMQEQRANARPELATTLEDISQYDTIYLGYPIWWGDMPMALYTFLESYDLSGKTVYPFVTHEGSGMAGTERKIAAACSDADVRDGLALRGSTAQNDAEAVTKAVNDYINK